MSKFLCVCGETIRISGAMPNPVELHLMSAATMATLPGTGLYDAFYDQAVFAFVCLNSGHLWVYWKGLDGPLTAYRWDDDDAHPADAHEWDRTARDWFDPITARCGCDHGPTPGPQEAGELERWWAISDVTFDSLAEDVERPGFDPWLLPVRRCPAGDHLWVWWSGADQPPATYTAIGRQSDLPEVTPRSTVSRPSAARRCHGWQKRLLD